MPLTVVLLGMSGVRIHDTELSALGMTLPGFIERGKVIASLPSLGLLTIAAELPDDTEVHYMEAEAFSPEIVEEAASYEPDLVAVSSLTAKVDEAYKILDALRQRGIRTCLGGLHASVMPDEAAKHADTVLVGDGEGTFGAFAKDLQSKITCGRYGSRVGSRDPWSRHRVPRYDLLDPGRYNRITIQTQRGCPLGCEFCGASRLIGRYREKPLRLVAQELEAICSLWPKPFIELADDNTFFNKKRGSELVRLMGRTGAKWFTETDISLADQDGLLEEIAQSGCAQLLIGFESVDTTSLAFTDPKGWKARRREGYLRSIDKIQGTGVSVNGCFVFGFDNDTPAVFEETLAFVRESKLSEVQITILTPFPGTELYARLLQEDRLRKERFWEQCTLFDVTFVPKMMSESELRQGFLWLAKEIYSEPETERRRQIRFKMMRRGHA